MALVNRQNINQALALAGVGAVDYAKQQAQTQIKEYFKKVGKNLAEKAIDKATDMATRKRKNFSRSKSRTRKQTKTHNKPIKRVRFKKRFNKNLVNVKADVDGYTKTFRKQKVTKQQQRKINRRFRQGYSPFKDFYDFNFQETIPQSTGYCKWIWRCHSHLRYLSKAFQMFPQETGTPGQALNAVRSNYYVNGTDQTVYFSEFKSVYEIVNPTNYDMNLEIYDLVCKQDTTNTAADAFNNVYSEVNQGATSTSFASSRNPIRLIELGLEPQLGYYPGNTTQATVTSDPTAKLINDITLHPTESYPFNIYFTIIKKHRIKLQPGASMKHVFIHKPKALINRGYWGYRYGKDTDPTDGDSERGIKDITCGCLFKFWGQVAGTGDSTGVGPDGTGKYSNMQQIHTDVTTLSGRIMFKEYVTNKWYAMNNKYTYNFRTIGSGFTPADEEDLEVANNVEIKKVDDADMQTDQAEPSSSNNESAN